MYINPRAKCQPKVVWTLATKQKDLVFRYSAGHRHTSDKTTEIAAAQKSVGLYSLHYGTNSHPFQEKKDREKHSLSLVNETAVCAGPSA